MLELVKVVIPAFSLLIAIVNLVIWFKTRVRKELSYEYSRVPVLRVAREVKRKLSILFQDEPVGNIDLIVLQVSNTGNTPITSEDYETPINFKVREPSKILSASVARAIPENLPASVSIKDQTVVVEPILLNRGDSIIIDMLIDEFDGTIRPDGRIVGVKKIESEEEKKARYISMLEYLSPIRKITVPMVLVAWLYLTFVMADRIGYRIELPSLLLGLVASFLTGFTWFNLSVWWYSVTKPFKQRVLRI